MDSEYASIILQYCHELTDCSPMQTDVRAIEIELPFNTTATITGDSITLHSDLQGIEVRIYFAYVLADLTALTFYDGHGRNKMCIDIAQARDYKVFYWEEPE